MSTTASQEAVFLFEKQLTSDINNTDKTGFICKKQREVTMARITARRMRGYEIYNGTMMFLFVAVAIMAVFFFTTRKISIQWNTVHIGKEESSEYTIETVTTNDFQVSLLGGVTYTKNTISSIQTKNGYRKINL